MKAAVKIDALRRDDGRGRIVKVQRPAEAPSIAAYSAPSVSGPVATMPASGSDVSSRADDMDVRVRAQFFGDVCGKRSLSTASAPPAGTRVASAASIVSEPSRRISSFRSPQALPQTSSLLKELEQTSSQKASLSMRGGTACGLLLDELDFVAAAARDTTPPRCPQGPRR